MSAAAEQIRFENLLELAKYAFKAGAFARVEEHLAEAVTLSAHERQLAEESAS
jgi:hypothetical protein